MKRIIAKRTLREFWNKYTDAEQPLKTWYETAKNSDWKSPQDIKEVYVTASIIKGNSYRLIVKFNYEREWAFIRFIGTHKDYDSIDATII